MDEEPRESCKNRRRGFQTRRGGSRRVRAHDSLCLGPEWPRAPREVECACVDTPTTAKTTQTPILEPKLANFGSLTYFLLRNLL